MDTWRLLLEVEEVEEVATMLLLVLLLMLAMFEPALMLIEFLRPELAAEG